MKKILWALSVVLVMAIATGASADIRSDKCNTYSNDLGISATLGNYSGDICAEQTKSWTGDENGNDEGLRVRIGEGNG